MLVGSFDRESSFLDRLRRLIFLLDGLGQSDPERGSRPLEERLIVLVII
jgi:hypothetical protein